ncbi:hypothetical protein RO3G_12227 [Rhizopus delemar RA 99-880]|uniref:AMP-dependent synthetase/ligase domain-containing protein n=1 Tax=Rhizopus delemar (strain RA 99-880 / ATCC MYA-4621 / FGSC 9543 / NRRL 43880) TaxID=246409 RepID=I1CGD6_RHIO9|nr:hypothetical protein RO3G_12227 [Rhizopus delemar RA 99-880]|eukprot:EIE87516.1 hypothetical protein RO3G_12227 [Rhizopus delemar RA 99-880]
MQKLVFPSGFPYVVTLLSIWALGGIAVPICTTHPLPEQIYSVQESQSSLVIGHPVFKDRLDEIIKETKLDFLEVQDVPVTEQVHISTFSADLDASALIIFTSGTTGKPKGAVLTHRNIDAQASCLTKAWYWSAQDRIHHILPLHHIHGIVNALICSLYCGATVEMYQKFDAAAVWSRWSDPELPKLSVFMSVPTVYAKLIQYYKTQDEETQEKLTKACKQFRFMVSGSASLPTTLRNTWRKLSGGQVLLERYGMTEIGMALSQEYVIWERVEGTVGIPLPGVQVRIMSETDNKDITELRDTPGTLQIKGPTVFKEYWQRPEATKKEFTEDGWFITGDVAQRVGQHGYYQILGRSSIDIIKTGGEKVSALEIERELLSCDMGIQDVAVVGIPDPEWGQKVSAVVVMENGKVKKENDAQEKEELT